MRSCGRSSRKRNRKTPNQEASVPRWCGGFLLADFQFWPILGFSLRQSLQRTALVRLRDLACSAPKLVANLKVLPLLKNSNFCYW
jgi:hypothetical protein